VSTNNRDFFQIILAICIEDFKFEVICTYGIHRHLALNSTGAYSSKHDGGSEYKRNKDRHRRNPGTSTSKIRSLIAKQGKERKAKRGEKRA